MTSQRFTFVVYIQLIDEAWRHAAHQPDLLRGAIYPVNDRLDVRYFDSLHDVVMLLEAWLACPPPTNDPSAGQSARDPPAR
jgi:hypothetical protein